MVDIAPFRALRWSDRKKKSDISTFICPPYDVISPHQRQSFARKKDPNVVELELPLGNDQEKYGNASEILRRWKEEGWLQEDRSASYYLLETTFRIKDAFAPKSRLKRYGLLSALKLEAPGKGAVHPHEKTLPKAKEDRLNLITALQTNVSPVFGLFFDPKNQWKKWVSKVIKQKPLVKGMENKDLSHRLWKVDAGSLQKEIRQILSSKDLYIADGHHRYEVSWAYQEKRLQMTPSADLHAGWRRVMTYVCPMEEAGLLMLPTHRLVKSSRGTVEWIRHLETFFDITPAKNMAEIIEAVSGKNGRAIGWASADGLALLRLRADISIDRCLPNRPPALRELDVVLLHDLALGEAVKPDFLTEKEIIFTRDLKGLEILPKRDPSWVGFVLGSPGVASLARVAGANEVMPPKTTYFYPKVPTGFTLMPLEQKIQ